MDLADINYATLQSPQIQSQTAQETDLTVTDGTHSANIALLGNYIASTFITALDSGTGTLLSDPALSSQQPTLAHPHS